MPYWQLFYHFVWTTKNREPLLNPQVEPIIYGYIRSKVIGLGGVLFALSGMPEHVHLVASVPPRLAVSTFIGQVKGVAATKHNKSGVADLLYWQEEYGVFSFDGKRLRDVVAYVENQKRHHAENHLIPVLERTAEGGVMLVRETTARYEAGAEAWWEGL
jgi:REP element-mobilizing transposase RayT